MCIPTLFNQSIGTAKEYFQFAEDFLVEREEYNFDRALRLAELMARDFDTMMRYKIHEEQMLERLEAE